MKRATGGLYERVKPEVAAVVAAIPAGRVTTYGAIAKHLGLTARQVAHVLGNFTPAESAELPWFRVVAANGVISSFRAGTVGRRQVARLRAEGVSVRARNRVADFDAVFWQPR